MASNPESRRAAAGGGRSIMINGGGVAAVATREPLALTYFASHESLDAADKETSVTKGSILPARLCSTAKNSGRFISLPLFGGVKSWVSSNEKGDMHYIYIGGSDPMSKLYTWI